MAFLSDFLQPKDTEKDIANRLTGLSDSILFFFSNSSTLSPYGKYQIYTCFTTTSRIIASKAVQSV